MTVKKPEELKQVTESVLANLTATEEMRSKIVYAAAQQKIGHAKDKKASGLLRFVPTVCCCLALLVCVSVLIPKANNVIDQQSLLPAITDMPAGNINPENDNHSRSGTELSSEGRKVVAGIGEQGIFCDTVPGQNVKTDFDASEPQIVVLDGCIYRLIDHLFSPEQLKLSSTAGILSVRDSFSSLSEGNISGSTFLNADTEVYFVDGMNHAFVAAEYQGNMCVFQRVSLNHHGLLNNESIESILPDASHVISLEIPEKGSITDSDIIHQLISILSENAIPESNDSLNSGEFMILNLDNGLQYQFTLNQQRVSFCGTWLCPEFIGDLEKYL